jgi:NitT/TauT family transport system substrate-binding protein
VPFLLKKNAEAWAAKSGGRLATYTEVLAVAKVGG